MVRVVDAEEAAAVIASGAVGAAPEWLETHHLPLLVVRGDDTATALHVPAHLPLVVVAVATVPCQAPPGADLYLAPGGPASLDRPWVGVPDVEEALDEVVGAVTANPQASVVLAQLLRSTARVNRSAALLAESLAYAALQAGGEHRHWLSTRTSRRPPRPGQGIRLERRSATLVVTLQRPERRNAYDAATRDALVDALLVAASDPAIERVELRGDGPVFCAGGDLDEFGTVPDAATAHLIRTTRSAGAAIAECPAHTVALMHGTCVGAGVELPAFADEVVAARGTTFRLPERAMGLVPGAGGTVSIPRRIGAPRAAWMALTGRAVAADVAVRWGLVDRLVDNRVAMSN